MATEIINYCIPRSDIESARVLDAGHDTKHMANFYGKAVSNLGKYGKWVFDIYDDEKTEGTLVKCFSNTPKSLKTCLLNLLTLQMVRTVEYLEP